MINNLLTCPLTSQQQQTPQVVEIVDSEFLHAPKTGAENPRTPENIENPADWRPDQWLGFGKVD
jgi:hypothetical protein